MGAGRDFYDYSGDARGVGNQNPGRLALAHALGAGVANRSGNYAGKPRARADDSRAAEGSGECAVKPDLCAKGPGECSTAEADAFEEVVASGKWRVTSDKPEES